MYTHVCACTHANTHKQAHTHMLTHTHTHTQRGTYAFTLMQGYVHTRMCMYICMHTHTKTVCKNCTFYLSFISQQHNCKCQFGRGENCDEWHSTLRSMLWRHLVATRHPRPRVEQNFSHRRRPPHLSLTRELLRRQWRYDSASCWCEKEKKNTFDIRMWDSHLSTHTPHPPTPHPRSRS